MLRKPRDLKTERLVTVQSIFYAYGVAGVSSSLVCLLNYFMVFHSYGISPRMLAFSMDEGHFLPPPYVTVDGVTLAGASRRAVPDFASFDGRVYGAEQQYEIHRHAMSAWYLCVVLTQFWCGACCGCGCCGPPAPSAAPRPPPPRRVHEQRPRAAAFSSPASLQRRSLAAGTCGCAARAPRPSPPRASSPTRWRSSARASPSSSWSASSTSRPSTPTTPSRPPPSTVSRRRQRRPAYRLAIPSRRPAACCGAPHPAAAWRR